MAVSFKLPNPAATCEPARVKIIPKLPRLDFAPNPDRYPQGKEKKPRVNARSGSAPSLELQCWTTQARDGEDCDHSALQRSATQAAQDCPAGTTPER